MIVMVVFVVVRNARSAPGASYANAHPCSQNQLTRKIPQLTHRVKPPFVLVCYRSSWNVTRGPESSSGQECGFGLDAEGDPKERDRLHRSKDVDHRPLCAGMVERHSIRNACK